MSSEEKEALSIQIILAVLGLFAFGYILLGIYSLIELIYLSITA